MNKVHCEITGQTSSIVDTVVLTKINGIILLKNLESPEIYEAEKVIISYPKPPIKYYCELEVPFDHQSLLGRIFAIVDDEDELEQTTSILSSEGRRIYMGQQLFRFVEQAGDNQVLILPDTMFMAVVDNEATTNVETCAAWKVAYNSAGRKYRFKKILQEKKEAQTFGYPGILWPGFDVAVGDCSPKNLQGTGYLFKTDNNFQNVNLCSNESAVDFCKQENCLIYYNDFLNKGKLRILSPNTEDINTKLQNPYLYRSLNF